jgi:Holliday junction resolvasome RuvABC endonuclease subunit
VIVAGFDIATTTGCAVLDGDTVLRCSAFTAEGDTEAEIFTGFRAWFRGLLQYYNVDHVAIEQPLVTSHGSPATFRTFLRLYGLRAIAMQSAHGLGIPVIEVNQMRWRKAFMGRPRASKDETLAYAQTLVPGLKSKDAAEALGVAFYLKRALREQKEMGDAA